MSDYTDRTDPDLRTPGSSGTTDPLAQILVELSLLRAELRLEREQWRSFRSFIAHEFAKSPLAAGPLENVPAQDFASAARPIHTAASGPATAPQVHVAASDPAVDLSVHGPSLKQLFKENALAASVSLIAGITALCAVIYTFAR